MVEDDIMGAPADLDRVDVLRSHLRRPGAYPEMADDDIVCLDQQWGARFLARENSEVTAD